MKIMKFKKLLPLITLIALTACSFTIGDFEGSFDSENGSLITVDSSNENAIIELAAKSFETSLTKLFSGYSINGTYDFSYSVPVTVEDESGEETSNESSEVSSDESSQETSNESSEVSSDESLEEASVENSEVSSEESAQETSEESTQETSEESAKVITIPYTVASASFNFLREMGSLTSVEDLRDLPTGIELTNIDVNVNEQLLGQEIDIPSEWGTEITLGTKDGYLFADLSNNVISSFLTKFFYSKMGVTGNETKEEKDYIDGKIDETLDAAVGEYRKTYFDLKSVFNNKINAQSLLSEIRQSVSDLLSSLVNKFSSVVNTDMLQVKQYGTDAYGFKFSLTQQQCFIYLFQLVKGLELDESISIYKVLYNLSSLAQSDDYVDILNPFDLSFDIRMSPTTGIRSITIDIDLGLPNNIGTFSLTRNAVFTYRTPYIPDEFDMDAADDEDIKYWHPYTEWVNPYTVPEVAENTFYMEVGDTVDIDIQTLPLNLGSQFISINGPSSENVISFVDGVLTANGAGEADITISFEYADFVIGTKVFEYHIVVTDSSDETDNNEEDSNDSDNGETDNNEEESNDSGNGDTDEQTGDQN